eukprot:CAMPEP_0118703172 /NCGR_PEP_ID=MMETSP0800-20121206/18370_1 /TAXON_ID=210618 ORGANISM="Striatella unipunctata, Strain CCMP2910" /NCGR_SAMPLE_ID=MMETSP0800 /ASSEMBLY_ACC=CAM_ASM_000638 /LENGTH=286 /DNA_ID=CAMNT_0006604597 /DNA_START=441 /DNA_END=1301 /DNA_ORIENTATION=-
MRLGSDISTSIVCPQEQLDVTFVCQNNSRICVEQVRIAMMEVVEWTANSGKSITSKHELARFELRGDSIPELSSRGQQQHNYNNKTHTPFSPIGMHRRATLLIPHNARDTYQGQLVRVRHALTVTLVTPGMCCVTNPQNCSLMKIQRRLQSVQPTATTTTTAARLELVPQQQHQHHHQVQHQQYQVQQQQQQQVQQHQLELQLQQQLDQEVPEAQAALVLPDDWHAQTAEVVSVPMAEALVLGAANKDLSEYQQQTQPLYHPNNNGGGNNNNDDDDVPIAMSMQIS